VDVNDKMLAASMVDSSEPDQPGPDNTELIWVYVAKELRPNGSVG
jgi:hypothetical protein